MGEDKVSHGCGKLEIEKHYLKCTSFPHHKNKRHQLHGLQRWMTNSLTMKLLQIVLVRAISDWLRGCYSRTHESTETDSAHVLVKEALIERL